MTPGGRRSSPSGGTRSRTAPGPERGGRFDVGRSWSRRRQLARAHPHEEIDHGVAESKTAGGCDHDAGRDWYRGPAARLGAHRHDAERVGPDRLDPDRADPDRAYSTRAGPDRLDPDRAFRPQRLWTVDPLPPDPAAAEHLALEPAFHV
jgi:hypothetical protein